MAFWGGVFAGALRLNLDQEPLKSWVERTSKQAEVRTAHGGGEWHGGSREPAYDVVNPDDSTPCTPSVVYFITCWRVGALYYIYIII